MLSLDQVRCFVAVADELHFGRAAAALHMTQPPLSRAVQKLERVVGAQLLERDSRQVRLTPAGEVFLVDARRLLDLAGTAPVLARRVAEGARGALRVGFTAASAYRVLGDVVERLTASLPEVHLELSEMVTGEQVAGLLGGDLDLGLARPPFDRSAFASRLLRREPLLVALPLGHPLAAGGDAERPGAEGAAEPLDPEELVDEPLVQYSPVRARYFHDLVLASVPVRHDRVVHTVSQVLSVLLLVQAGRGVAVVPESALALGLEGVAYRRLRTRRPEPVEVHLLWAREAANPVLPRALAALAAVPTTGG
ncbi:LysR substrate-binding domain-containing protein [uncultured Pseudokineococcus sp.]|uniref:LysR substrate-binding domain-containing protein n=1 Tax=uncultured Pseudokineococcus sp. TaxID=1642928 RepID=UPI00344A0738